MATAVALASPVIMMTLIPARLHKSILLDNPCRGGSLIATSPTNVKPDSISINLLESLKISSYRLFFHERSASKESPSFTARAIHRRARSPIELKADSIRFRISHDMGMILPSRSLAWEQRSRSIPGAPLTSSLHRRPPSESLSSVISISDALRSTTNTPMLFRFLSNSKEAYRSQRLVKYS